MSIDEIEELSKWGAEHLILSLHPIGKRPWLLLDKSKGVVLQDMQGKEYIDTASQLVCVNLGYGRTEIIDAVVEEMKRLQYCMHFYGFCNKVSIKCGQKLAELTPEGLDHFHFTAGGSESTETAFRFARLFWHNMGKSTKHKIISLYGSYHGMSYGAMSADGVGKGVYEVGIGPMTPGFIHIPPYYCYRCMFGMKYPDCGIRCAQFLAETIEKEGEGTVAAFIAEPVLGVCGCIAPPPEYWPMVREICTNHNVLLIADEVMTGFCRTGKMFAVEHWGIKPDMMAMAKGLTSAYFPLGVVAVNDKVYDGIKEGRGGFTYGGFIGGPAAAIKTMEIYVNENVAEKAARAGKYSLDRLKSEFMSLPCVDDVGGLGLMLGFEIVADKATKKPFDLSVDIMGQIQSRALERGVFVRVIRISAGLGDRVIFSPPLVITTKELDKALGVLYGILTSLK